MKGLIPFACTLGISIFLIMYGNDQEKNCEKQYDKSIAYVYCGIIPLPYVIITLPIMMGGIIISTSFDSPNYKITEREANQ